MPLNNVVKHFVARAEDRSEEHHYFLIGLAAAMIANIVFAGLRFANEQIDGKATGYWINVVGALGLALLTMVYWRDRRRYLLVLQLGLALCAFCLVLPARYGMVSSPWWLSILPLAATLLIGPRAGLGWAVICIALNICTQLLAPRFILPDAAGEAWTEAIASRAMLVILLFGISLRFRIVVKGQAIQLRRASDEMARESKKYRTLLSNASDAIYIVNAEGLLVEANKAFLTMHGYDESAVGKFRVTDWVMPSPWESIEARLDELIGRQGQFIFETRHRRSDGSTLEVENNVSAIKIDGKQYLYAASRDITERKKADHALQESEAKYRRIVENSPDVAYMFSMTKGGVYYSPTVQAVLGYSAEQLCKNPFLWAESIHPDDSALVAKTIEEFKTGTPFKIEYRVKNSGGDWRWLFDRSIGVREEDGELIVEGLAMDITERKQAESQIQALAFSDPLTGLPNRRLLMDRVDQALTAAHRHAHQVALLFIDMDNFKTLNDTLGHDKGDSLLKQVAQRLITCVRQGDTVARLGGDEFVVLLEDLSKSVHEAATQAQIVTAKILNALGQPYEIEGHGHHSTASIGVTLFGGPERENTEEPLKRAELAMYQAKAAGRNTLRFFEPEMATAVTTRATLEAELREAVTSGQFVLYYQPQGGGHVRMSGVEALVRWQHPQRGLVSPVEFIHIAEANGLILSLGRWVLETACKQLAAWAPRPEMSQLTIAVNVSARQFRQPNFVEEVLTIVNANGAKPERLKIELTESVLVDNVEDIIVKMNALKAKGVGFSLDDFGTGYSSLSYLKRLPLDQLKIDRSFVRDILTDPDDAAIAKMVVALAESLGLSVIAEGVETGAQRDFLANLGCHSYQGYLFSRPMPIVELEAFAARA